MAILFYEIRRKNVSVAYAAPTELLHKTFPSQLVEQPIEVSQSIPPNGIKSGKNLNTLERPVKQTD
ncbi:hypothetical protein K0M31_012160 [Melipona bicolor]|uniref:Uncharacterized protein n=1 Tax=Melipona bicolor TaxID=60889 RepID=A0AA40FKM2_9HYME|nr:hypothetical protein K0M31_012160 [Melipona bicolor]